MVLSENFVPTNMTKNNFLTDNNYKTSYEPVIIDSSSSMVWRRDILDFNTVQPDSCYIYEILKCSSDGFFSKTI